MRRGSGSLLDEELSVDVGNRRVVLMHGLHGNVRFWNFCRRGNLAPEQVICAGLKQTPIHRAKNVAVLAIREQDAFCQQRFINHP